MTERFFVIFTFGDEMHAAVFDTEVEAQSAAAIYPKASIVRGYIETEGGSIETEKISLT